MAPVENGAEALLPFAGESRRIADPDRGLDEALGGEGEHDVELGAELERGLGENDVGTGGERAIDDADMLRLEQGFGAPPDLGLGRFLRRLVHLLASEEMAGEHRDVARAELVHERLHVGAERLGKSAELQDGRCLGAVVAAARRPRFGQHRLRFGGIA